MAYDLISRQQTPRSYSRESGSTALVSPQTTDGTMTQLLIIGALGTVATIAWSLPKAKRSIEKRRYRREFSGDLDTTQVLPAISMKELIYGNKR